MPTDPTDALNLVNAGYVADLYEQYRRDPASVDPEWRSLFDSGAGGFEPVAAAAPSAEGNGAGQQADAQSAAEAAMCAGEQKAFWDFHDKLFGSATLGNATYLQYAQDLNLNQSSFETCLVNG